MKLNLSNANAITHPPLPPDPVSADFWGAISNVAGSSAFMTALGGAAMEVVPAVVAGTAFLLGTPIPGLDEGAGFVGGWKFGNQVYVESGMNDWADNMSLVSTVAGAWSEYNAGNLYWDNGFVIPTEVQISGVTTALGYAMNSGVGDTILKGLNRTVIDDAALNIISLNSTVNSWFPTRKIEFSE